MVLSNLLIDTLKGLFTRNSAQTGPRIVFLTSIGLLFMTFAISRIFHSEIAVDIMTGCILSVTNAFLGYTFIERGFQYNNNLFMVFSLGGMALRFFLMLASVAAVLVLTSVIIPAFVASFMGSYAVFLFIEVFYINNKVDRMKQKKLELSIIES